MLEFAGINKIETIGAFAQIWFRTDVEYFRNPVLTRLVNNGSGSDAGEEKDCSASRLLTGLQMSKLRPDRWRV